MYSKIASVSHRDPAAAATVARPRVGGTLYSVPEGPEVETLRRQMSDHLPALVRAVSVTHPRSVRNSILDLSLLEGSLISGVSRLGKWLSLSLSPADLLSSHTQDSVSLSVHLRMSGRLHLKDVSDPLEKHTHVSLSIETKDSLKRLDFIDPRTFGEVRLSLEPGFSSTGFDIATPVNLSDLDSRVLDSRKPIKTVLLEQGMIVSGVGNYLADEVCHAASVSPLVSVSSLPGATLQRVLEKIPVLFESFARLRGTALADEGWRDLYGVLGDGSSALQVHGRTDCRACAAPVNRIKIGGRSAYICPVCQP